jgi:hypothetical protein
VLTHKNRLIPMLTKLIQSLAGLLNNYDIFSKVNSVTGEGANNITLENYIDSPEKYSIKKLNLSLLSLLDKKIFDLVFVEGCQCKRMLYVLRIFNVAIATTFTTLNASLCMSSKDKIICHGCQQEVGCNTDVLLVRSGCQLPVNWKVYIFDSALLLDVCIKRF